MSGTDIFKADFPKSWDNLNADLNIDNKQKEDFINHLNAFTGSNIKAHAIHFFDSYDLYLTGPEIHLADECLGRLTTSKVLLDVMLAEIDDLDKDPIRAKEILRDWLLKDGRDQLLEIINYAGACHLSLYNMWSFRNKNNPTDPITGLDLDILPCILGITQSKPFVLLRHKPNTSVYQPTFFDARLDEAWSPGGYTLPLEACKEKDGLPELVHEPCTFNELALPLKEIL